MFISKIKIKDREIESKSQNFIYKNYTKIFIRKEG